MCKRECYARDFLNGTMYMNTVGWFHDNVDDLEGSILLRPPELRELRLNGRIVHSARRLVLKPKRVRNLNAFCMFAMHTGPFDRINTENMDALRDQLQIPDTCVTGFGQYAVFVYDIAKFFCRVDAAMERYQRGQRDLVKYYDPESSSNLSDEMDIPFFKPIRFSNEKEYRIVIDTEKKNECVLKLDIGPIHDIAKLYKSNSIHVDIYGDESTRTLAINISAKEI